MSETIWKFKINELHLINAPIGIKILSVGRQFNNYYIWGIVNKSNPLADKEIVIRGTGQTFEGTEGDFIGTVISNEGRLVVHFFTSND